MEITITMMTPEEKFSSDVWVVLQEIKTRFQYTKTGSPVIIKIYYNFLDGTRNAVSNEDRAAIMEKLDEWGAIEIVDRREGEDEKHFYFHLIQPKFDEVYNKYDASVRSEESQSKNNWSKKLLNFNQEIQSHNSLDKEFQNLIGIRLFDFIQEHSQLKAEFERHAFYLQRLAKDEAYIANQEQIFDAIVKIAKLTTQERIEELQKEWKNAFINRLRIKGKRDVESLTLPELYEAMQKKESYYILGEEGRYDKNSDAYIGVYSDVEDLSAYTPISCVRNQYKIIDRMLEFIGQCLPEEHVELRERYLALIKEYNRLTRILEEMIYHMAVKLHVREFEDYLITCAQIRPIEGYEIWQSSFFSLQDNRVEHIKKSCKVVTEDLAEFAERDRDTTAHVHVSQAVISSKTAHLNEKVITTKPYTIIDGKWGYFKFYKEGEKIKVGNINSRQFKLLQRLCDPVIGTHWKIESIFDAIRQPKDAADNRLTTDHLRNSRMLEIIEWAKKELQKNNRLQGKLIYKFDGQKKMMWLEVS